MHSNELDELVRDIYGLAAANRELQRRAVPEHPPACIQALSVIARTDARRVSEVADRMRIDLSVASRQVAVLEAQGWVRRERDPDDGRAQRLEATAAGLAALGGVRARMAGGDATVLAGWGGGGPQALPAPLARPRRGSRRSATSAHGWRGRTRPCWPAGARTSCRRCTPRWPVCARTSRASPSRRQPPRPSVTPRSGRDWTGMRLVSLNVGLPREVEWR